MQTPRETSGPSSAQLSGLRGDCAYGHTDHFTIPSPTVESAWPREAVMPLKTLGVITIPDGANSDFDHAAFDPKTRRVFIAHTARDCIEVIDHDAQKHIAALPGFPGV